MVPSEPRFDVALVGAVFPVPSVGEELAAAACADLCIVPVLLLHLPPVGDAAAGGAEESLCQSQLKKDKKSQLKMDRKSQMKRENIQTILKCFP